MSKYEDMSNKFRKFFQLPTSLVAIKISDRELDGQRPKQPLLFCDFVRKAATFKADIRIQNLSRRSGFHDAKSLTDLLLAGVDCDHRVRLIASGVDAQEALEALMALIKGKEG